MKHVLIVQNKFKEIVSVYPYNIRNLKHLLAEADCEREKLEEFCAWITYSDCDGSASLVCKEHTITLIDVYKKA